MEMLIAAPDWVVWCAAGVAGAAALAAVARVISTAVEFESR